MSSSPLPVEKVNLHCEVRGSVIHGRGLFARRAIRAGTKIVEYLGELIDKEESTRRGLALMESSKQTGGASVYIFDLNETHDLDGNFEWNPARLCNHSCEPNCEVVNEEDRLFMYALRDISKGEELSFDYGYDIEHFMEHPCRCGSASCVGYIVRKDQRLQLKRRLRRGKGKSLLARKKP